MGVPLTLLTRLGAAGRRHFLGALVPGVVLLTEVWLLHQRPARVEREGFLSALSSGLQDVPVVVVLLLGLVVVVAAAWTGYMARWFIWFMLIDRPSRWRKTLGFAETRASLAAAYGEPNIARGLEAHAPLAHALEAGRSQEAFEYAKLFLRVRAPLLSVDEIEAEINALLASIAPLLVLPLVLEHFDTGSPWVLWPSCSLVIAAIVRNVWELQGFERRESLRNVLLYEWYGSLDATSANPEDASAGGE